jgi:hypothetical protein
MAPSSDAQAWQALDSPLVDREVLVQHMGRANDLLFTLKSVREVSFSPCTLYLICMQT